MSNKNQTRLANNKVSNSMITNLKMKNRMIQVNKSKLKIKRFVQVEMSKQKFMKKMTLIKIRCKLLKNKNLLFDDFDFI